MLDGERNSINQKKTKSMGILFKCTPQKLEFVLNHYVMGFLIDFFLCLLWYMERK